MSVYKLREKASQPTAQRRRIPESLLVNRRQCALGISHFNVQAVILTKYMGMI